MLRSVLKGGDDEMATKKPVKKKPVAKKAVKKPFKASVSKKPAANAADVVLDSY